MSVETHTILIGSMTSIPIWFADINRREPLNLSIDSKTWQRNRVLLPYCADRILFGKIIIAVCNAK